MTDQDLQQRLATLPANLEWPQLRDVTPAVMAAVARTGPERRPARTVAMPWRPVARRAAPALLVVIAVALSVLLVSPGARQAVADWLGVPGITVRSDSQVPLPPAGTFEFGDAVTLEEAQRRAGFPVRTLRPNVGTGGTRFFFDDRVEGGLVHILYAVQPGLPDAAGSGAGAILTQFASPLGEPYFSKQILKSSSTVTATLVRGQPALWVASPSHLLIPNREGQPVREDARLSANALLWTSRSGVTYRLEAAVGITEAVGLAETIR